MSDLTPFAFDGMAVRAITDEHGEPWFIAADVTSILGYKNGRDAVGSLPERMRGSVAISDGTPGNPNRATVNESGLYRLVMRSTKPDAERFQDWVAEDVLPAIRRTGGYQVAAITPRQLAELVIVESDRADRAEHLLIEQAPKVQVAERLLDASGDMSVADAAKVLKARAGIKGMGRDRLFSLLHTWGWIYRQAGRWTPKQTAIDTGRLSIEPQSHYHPRTGELVLDPSQVRVTPKGLQRILSDLTADELTGATR